MENNVKSKTEGSILYRVNGNTLRIDKTTGGIRSLRRKGCPEFLSAPCGLVDIAWPFNVDYDIFRLSPCAANPNQPPEITLADGSLTIRYTEMAQNTPTPDGIPEMEGGVEAVVSLAPDPDGESIRLRCTVTNHSPAEVRQILFPNLEGLAAVSGEEEARFTTSVFHNNPYVCQASNERTRQGFFGDIPCVRGQFYRPGGFITDGDTVHYMGFRWFDYGSLRAGLSLYRRYWGFGPENMKEMGKNDTYWVKLNHADRTIRIASIQEMHLKTGETYDSGEYVLTPHKGGWVNGIGAFKSWLKSNQKRIVPVPRCMKEWMGFRTIWMGTGYPCDPDDAVWTYADMPELAKEAAEHGLPCLNLWGSFEETMPLSEKDFCAQYGGFEGFMRGVEACRAQGVEPSVLLSHVQIWYKDAVKRGLEINMSWAESLKAIPVTCASYMNAYSSHGMDDLSRDWWQEGARASLKFLRDVAHCPSVMWDQYMLLNGNRALEKMINDYRLETYEKYPEAFFGGESTFWCESDIDNCDTQWSWLWWEPQLETDFRPYLYAVETQRPNINVDSSPLFARYIFMDNAMMNAYPSKPDSLNGSAWIRDYPGFSETLKHLSGLRARYLDFFTDGENLGDCPLKKTCRSARLGFYCRNGAMLAFAVLAPGKRTSVFEYDLTGYTGQAVTGVTVYDEQMRFISEQPAEKKGKIRIDGNPEELYVLEFHA